MTELFIRTIITLVLTYAVVIVWKKVMQKYKTTCAIGSIIIIIISIPVGWIVLKFIYQQTFGILFFLALCVLWIEMNNSIRVKEVIARSLLTIGVLYVYGYIWMAFELVIDGSVTNRPVDNLMMIAFLPVIWLSTKEIYDTACQWLSKAAGGKQ